MASLIIIHGTGVRKESYDATFEIVKRKVQLARENLTAVPCYWGHLGANLPKDPHCLPREIDYRGEGASKAQIPIEGWAVLYEYPTHELRGYAANVGQGRGKSQIRELSDHIRTIQPDNELSQSLESINSLAAWQNARKEVIDNPAFLPAVQAALDDSSGFRAVVARAIVAMMTAELLDKSLPVPDNELRDQWVLLTMNLFRPVTESDTTMSTRGLAELKQNFRGMIGRGGQSLVAGFVERKRMVECETIGTVIGDIIRYQADRGGVAIRQEIIQAIRAAPKPRYVLAHSLGSVAIVDALVLHKDLEVTQLITIGCPAPVFYELDALASLKPTDNLPEHFPPWTNIYDPRDMISYIAHRTFHYDKRVNDVAHESGQPLIAAHSAYWASNRAWAHIWKVIP